MSISRATPVENFGRNVRFEPSVIETPGNEIELVDILKRHRGKRLRCVGRLHSWSPAVVAEEVLVDTSLLNRVTVHIDSEHPWAEIEAGCQIKHVLRELERQGGFTLPSLGLITEQTIAGATATATHGSGRHSLSHYIQSLRVACYDPATGEACVRVIDAGAELQAARCSLGCLGLISSVRIPIRRQYQIEEHFYRYDSLEDVLRQESEYPLQQFYLVPWRWDFFAQQRREVERPRSGLAWLYRLYWGVGMDIGLHIVVSLLARVLPRSVTRFFYRWIMPSLVPQGWRVIDQSDRQLTMEHELFRHIEIEVFVATRHLAAAIDFVEWLLCHCDGRQAVIEAEARMRLERSGLWEQLQRIGGAYCHHYPICIRKVLPDDTLISMTAQAIEPWYAISFISYAHPSRREGFFQFAELLAKTMSLLFDGRPHWGKYCPLPREELHRLYPLLDEFCRVRGQADSSGVFTNDWLHGVMTPSA